MANPPTQPVFPNGAVLPEGEVGELVVGDEAQSIWREASKAHPANEVLTSTIKRFLP